MLQTNKNALEEIVDNYRVNLEAKGSYVSPSLVRWAFVTLLSISTAFGCNLPTNYRLPQQPPAPYGQRIPTHEETNQLPLAIQKELQSPIKLEPVYSDAYVGEKFVRNLDELSKKIKGKKEYYTLIFFSENVDRVEINHEGLTYNKIKGNQIVYTPKKIEVGQPKRIPVIIKTEHGTYELDLNLNIVEKTPVPKGLYVPPEKLGRG